jgi:hypothetical protein
MNIHQQLTVYSRYVRCPVCNEQNIDPLDFMDHVLNEHPYFFVVWASLNMPWMYTESILDGDDGIDAMSYEYLSELCEAIGNHSEGIRNMDDVTTVSDAEEEICPICLDSIKGKQRKINVCSHVFCCDCISKWLSMRKTCPVCIRDVRQDQMSFTTNSPDVSSNASSSFINTT